MKAGGKLTAKQARFVAEYLVDLNATQAAIRSGYSARTAEVQGPRLLGNVRVARAVAEGQAKRIQKLDLTAERVLAEIMRLGFSDVRKLYRPDGSLLPPTEWDDDAAAAVSGVEVVEMAGGLGAEGGAIGNVPMYTKKVKLWDKKGSLEMLARHLRLLTDKVELTGASGKPITVTFGGRHKPKVDE